MEGGDVRVASASMGSSSIWRSSPADAFYGSSRRDDDEEDLKWAEIQKLPTYLRMTRGILAESEGQPQEIDINKLGPLQRKKLVERLVKIAEEENERFLLKLRNRIDRVGLDFPTIEVHFKNLNVEAEAHVGSRALPTIFNFCVNTLEVITYHHKHLMLFNLEKPEYAYQFAVVFPKGFLNSLHLIPCRKKPFTILHDVSGIIKPKR